MIETNVNTQYKDRLFRFLFGNEAFKSNALELYNALNGTNYTDCDALEITTIDDVIYMNMKNDVSFIIGDSINLYEHQSTYNPNMPVRGLIYFGRLYDKYIKTNEINVYSKTLKELPVPRYVVFYNGLDKKIDSRKTLSLLDAFPEESRQNSCVNVTALMININADGGDELLEKCRTLQDYANFVDMVRKRVNKGYPLEVAINQAMDACITLNILKKYFVRHKSEVYDMVLTEFDNEKYEANIKAEAKEEGRIEGLKEGREEGLKEGREEGLVEGHQEKATEIALNMLTLGFSVEEISAITGLPDAEVAELQ